MTAPTPYDELRERLALCLEGAVAALARAHPGNVAHQVGQATGSVQTVIGALRDDARWPAPPAAEAAAAASGPGKHGTLRDKTDEWDARQDAAASEQEARCPACGQVCGTWAASEPEYAYQPPPEITSGSVSASEPPPAAGPREQPAASDMDALAKALDEIIGCDREESGSIAHDLLQRFRLVPREQPAGDRLTEGVEAAAERLDNMIATLRMPLSASTHVEALRDLLPDLLADLRRLAPAPSPAPAEQGEQS